MDGWEPSTAYEYDEQGRLLRSTPEAEWDPLQRAWLVALDLYEAGLCKRCGHSLEETTDPANDFNNPVGTGWYALAPGFPMQCHCCAALERSEQQVAAQNPQHPAAILHAVRLVPRG